LFGRHVAAVALAQPKLNEDQNSLGVGDNEDVGWPRGEAAAVSDGVEAVHQVVAVPHRRAWQLPLTASQDRPQVTKRGSKRKRVGPDTLAVTGIAFPVHRMPRN